MTELYLTMPFSATFLYILASILMLLLGGGIFLKNTKSKAFISFFLFAFFGVLWASSLYFGFLFGTEELIDKAVLYFKFTFALGIISLAFIPIFFYYFLGVQVHINLFWICTYLLTVALTALFSIFTDFFYIGSTVIVPHLHLVDTLGDWYWFYAFFSLFCFIFGVFMGLKKRHLLKGIESQKMIIASLGLLSLTFIFITNIILPVFGIYTLQLYSPLFPLFFLIPTFYAIVRYRFPDPRILLQSCFTIGSRLALYALPIFIGINLLSQSFLFGMIGLMIVVEVFAAQWLDRYVGMFWNYMVFQKSTNKIQDIEKSFDHFRVSVKEGLNEMIRGVGVNNGQFVLASEAPMKELTSFFQTHNEEELVRDEVAYGLKKKTLDAVTFKPLEAEMEQYMVSLVVPIFDDQKKLLGLFLLENKIDGTLFASQEIKALKKVMKDSMIYISKESEYKHILNQNEPVEFMNALMHEIRHPLFVARTTQDLVDWKAERPEDRVHLKESEQALGDLTRKLDKISEAFSWQHSDMDLPYAYLDMSTFLDRVGAHFTDQDMTYEIGDRGVKDLLFAFDPQSLEEAFCEIIKNGFFFNKSPSPKVHIALSGNNRKLIFDISDNGIGIDERHWSHIFQLLFVVAASRNPQECGLGLGLTKAYGIINQHGGTCRVLASSDQGTVMRVELPLESR